jgi:hypothetical protein
VNIGLRGKIIANLFQGDEILLCAIVCPEFFKNALSGMRAGSGPQNRPPSRQRRQARRERVLKQVSKRLSPYSATRKLRRWTESGIR